MHAGNLTHMMHTCTIWKGNMYVFIEFHRDLKGNIVTTNRAWNQSAGFRLTQWFKIMPHMMRSYYCCCCCCINEPVIFSHCVHLKIGHRFHALLKVCSDRDDIVPLTQISKTTYGIKSWGIFIQQFCFSRQRCFCVYVILIHSNSWILISKLWISCTVHVAFCSVTQARSVTWEAFV